jgi:hypothetical protein
MDACSTLRRAAAVGAVLVAIAGVAARTAGTHRAASVVRAHDNPIGIALAPDKADSSSEEVKR